MGKVKTFSGMGRQPLEFFSKGQKTTAGGGRTAPLLTEKRVNDRPIYAHLEGGEDGGKVAQE